MMLCMNQHVPSSVRREHELTITGVENETFLTQITLKDDHSRPFTVRLFQNLQGYSRNGQPINCRDCQKSPAVIRAEIESIEPQGSEYYCAKDLPNDLQLSVVNA